MQRSNSRRSEALQESKYPLNNKQPKKNLSKADGRKRNEVGKEMKEADVAASRLREALAEQERQTNRYAEAVGTTSELTAFARLQAANLAVTNCDRVARGIGRGPQSGAR